MKKLKYHLVYTEKMNKKVVAFISLILILAIPIAAGPGNVSSENSSKIVISKNAPDPQKVMEHSRIREEKFAEENKKSLYELGLISGIIILILFALMVLDNRKRISFFRRSRRRLRRRILYLLIRRGLSKGESYFELKTDLMKNGWKKKHIEDAIYRYKIRTGSD